MNDRIHAWLDGELPLEELSAAEQDRARRVRDALDMATAAESASAPSLADAVMARIDGLPAPRRSLVFRMRRAVATGGLALRPAALLAAASLAIGFGLGTWAAETAGPEGTTAAVEAEAPTVFVRFDLQVEGARSVQLAGSFSGWEPAYDLSAAGDDHWTATVPLSPGVHDYVFIVDGERHVLDPAAPRIADGFGSFNNRIALLASST